MKKVSDLFFVCDICGHIQEPNFELSKKISDDKANKNDFPIHCNYGMRLTILEMEKEEKSTINTESAEWGVIETLKVYFQKTIGNDKLGEIFENTYKALMEQEENLTDLMTMYSLRKNIRPALETVLNSENDISSAQLLGENIIDRALGSAKKRLNSPQNSGPVLPGSDPTLDIQYFCTSCKKHFEIPENEKKELLSDSEDREIPTHHQKPMEIRIKVEEKPVREKPPSKPFSFDMGGKLEKMDLLSVGVDIGSSTSHLIFSKLKLEREPGFLNMTNRFNIVDREILYGSEIINTPLIDPETIDVEKVVAFCKNEYRKAGFRHTEIDTGAVIVTGETAKKTNAKEIVERISSETGKFVSATAGPNYESLLAAMGSGAVKRSQEMQNTILSVDIGGGTSNLAISSNGHVQSTSCINVGGRLLGIYPDFKIWRIDDPTRFVMKELGINYNIGDQISEEHIQKISEAYTQALIEVMLGNAKSNIAKHLMMTENLDFSMKIDELMFCGGVSEYFNGEEKNFNDIGKYIAKELSKYKFGTPIIEAKNTIRATVIGAGSYSLAVSGSTCFYDDTITFPLENIPILKVDAMKEDPPEKVTEKILRAYQKFDLKEGEDIVGLYFAGVPIIHHDMYLPGFVKAIQNALPKSQSENKLVVLLFEFDIGGMVGRTLMKETEIRSNFISLDEIQLEEGDYIDIGTPLHEGHSFPIIVKSLAFI